MRRLVQVYLIVWAMLLPAICFAGSPDKTAHGKDNKAKDDIYEKVEVFADALSSIRDEYVEEADSKKLIYGAMKGMLESLDDYSQFMDPDEFNEIKAETKGEFGGIGVEVSKKDGILTVVTPMAGTPAESAGVKPGDKIVKIDGKITRDLSLNDAVKMMRGKPGSMITLTVWRDGLSNIIDIPVKRDIIKIRSIKRAEIIDDKIGYIKLVEFQENTALDLDEAVRRLKVSGMDSLILDLRNNPGGLFEGALDVSERFLAKDKTIVSIRSRSEEQNILFKSSGKYAMCDLPLIVLVNEGSASASEIVAGAIKDNKRGIVMGAKTFGKASVQTVIPMKDGSALKLTTACYITPSGKLIKGEGITPDVIAGRSVVAAKEKDPADDIFDGLEDPVHPGDVKGQAADIRMKIKPGHKKEERDDQLEAAINLMKAIKIYRSEERG